MRGSAGEGIAEFGTENGLVPVSSAGTGISKGADVDAG